MEDEKYPGNIKEVTKWTWSSSPQKQRVCNDSFKLLHVIAQRAENNLSCLFVSTLASYLTGTDPRIRVRNMG